MFLIIFLPLQSPVNAFISSFYFYVNIENMPSRIMFLNISFSIVKNMSKAKADFNHASKRVSPEMTQIWIDPFT